VLYGKPGRGKTHLAIAVAYRAIQNGFTARFITAAALIDELAAASRDGEMKNAIAAWVHPNVLVIDEMGYLAYGIDAANLLFHVVNERHLKRRSMVFTTNKPLNSWGKVLHDPDLGETIVDRILERGSVLRLDGPSVRSRHVDPKDLDGPDPVGSEPARISGTDRPEFPEPAPVLRDEILKASVDRRLDR
jgi:DNA replication protein DnaC